MEAAKKIQWKHALRAVQQYKKDGIDPSTRKQYEIALQEGKEEDRTIRVMIIGCYGQGKTTLANRLLSQDVGQIESTNGIDIYTAACSDQSNKWEYVKNENIIHETMKRLASVHVPDCEIGIHKENEPLNYECLGKTYKENAHQFSKMKRYEEVKNEYRFSLWDFGGQYVFYSTHQLFHSRHAIYLLVFDLTKDLNTPITDDDYPGGTHPLVRSMKDYIEFWMASIHSYVGTKDGKRPYVILVGTHTDKLKDKTEPENYFENVRKIFDGRNIGYHIHPESFAVSGTDPSESEFDRLREIILQIGKEDPQLLPARWIPLEQALRKKQHNDVVSMQEIKEMNKKLKPPVESNQLKSFLKFHHAKGTIIYFDEDELADRIVVNPSFLVNAFKCIITSGKFCSRNAELRPLLHELVSYGILKKEFLDYVWGKHSSFKRFTEVLIAFLKKHRIISEVLKFDEKSDKYSPLGYYIVPSFLRNQSKGEMEAFIEDRSRTSVSLVYVFDNEKIVPTVYHRLTGAAIGTWPVVDFTDSKLLFENVGVYTLEMKYAGTIACTENKIEIQIIQLCEGELIPPEVPDKFRRFVERCLNDEFKKLSNDEDEKECQPFSVEIRCQHSYHKQLGSKKTYALTKLNERKTVCCPDYGKHEGIDVEKMLQEWFQHTMIEKQVPKRRLTGKELTKLSTAIGFGWRILGTNLGFTKVALDQIEMDNSCASLRIFTLLQQWDQDKLDHATLDILVAAIKSLPPDSVNRDILKNVIDGVY